MNSFELINLAISLLSIIVAAVALVRSRVLAQEQLRLEKITAELSELQIRMIKEQNRDKDKALFNVNLIRKGKSYCFYIHNKGQGSAYNVSFELVDCEDNPLVKHEIEALLPYKELKPNSRITLPAALHYQSPLKYQAKLNWEDKEGNKHDDTFWTSL